MKLNEALNILKKNNYICEFLNHFFDVDTVLNRICKETGIKYIKKTTAANLAGGDFTFLNNIKDKNELNNLKKQISDICAVYNYNCNFICNDKLINVSLDCLSDKCPSTIYKPKTNFNIFLHGSKIEPDVILRTGIRPKIAVPGYDARVYLESLDLVGYKNYKAIANILMKPNGFGEYGIFHYLIKLPNNYKIFKDPEGDNDINWVYTKQSIPPDFILYLGMGGTYYDEENDDYIDLEYESEVDKNDILNFITK